MESKINEKTDAESDDKPTTSDAASNNSKKDERLKRLQQLRMRQVEFKKN